MQLEFTRHEQKHKDFFVIGEFSTNPFSTRVGGMSPASSQRRTAEASRTGRAKPGFIQRFLGLDSYSIIGHTTNLLPKSRPILSTNMYAAVII